MKKYLIAITFSTLLVCLSGCRTSATWVYPAKMADMTRVSDSPVFNKTVVVAPFDDCRSTINSQAAWLIAIPLIPYDWVEYNRPEGTTMFATIHDFNFNPAQDLSRAAAMSLRRSNLFAQVSCGDERDNADLVLHGIIKSTKYTGCLSTYCLSALGACFWVFGLPCGNSENELIVEFSLMRGNRIVWEYTFSRQIKILQGYHSRWGHDVAAYSELMQTAMNEAISDMAKTFRKQPELLEDRKGDSVPRHENRL